MPDNADPKRLRDGSPAGATERWLLDGARSAGPTKAQCDALWVAVSQRVPLAGSGAAGSGGAATQGATSCGLSASAGKMVGLVGALKATVVVAVGASAAAVGLPLLHEASPVVQMAVVQAPVERAPSVPAMSSLRSAGVPPAEVEAPPAKILGRDTSHARERRSAPRPPIDGPSGAHGAVPTSSRWMRAESALLLHARDALRSHDCPQALEALNEARRRFPAGILAQEREALSVEALECVGLRDEAADRAAAFLRENPTSPLSDFVRRFDPSSAAFRGAVRQR